MLSTPSAHLPADFFTPALNIGLSGGIAMGKSAALAIFAELGAKVQDADQVVHRLLKEDRDLIDQIVARWGQYLLTEHGIDRKALAAKVFGHAEELAALEVMIHPSVRQAIDSALIPSALNVVAIPLLFEKGWASRFDYTVCVWSPADQQAIRLAARGWTEAESAARLAAQMSADDKLQKADFGLINDRDFSHLRQQIIDLLSNLTGKNS